MAGSLEVLSQPAKSTVPSGSTWSARREISAARYGARRNWSAMADALLLADPVRDTISDSSVPENMGLDSESGHSLQRMAATANV